jgi:hypothetical protein
MSSDVHSISGPKEHIYSNSINDMVALVRQTYSKATAEGSCGSYSFWVDKKIVAEAWMHPTKPGWWIRILK